MKKVSKPSIPAAIKREAKAVELFLLSQANIDLTIDFHKKLLTNARKRVEHRCGRLDPHQFMAEATTDCWVNGYIWGALRALDLIRDGATPK